VGRFHINSVEQLQTLPKTQSEIDISPFLKTQKPSILYSIARRKTTSQTTAFANLRMGECPSNSPFLKNNGAEAPQGPRPIVFKEWRDTRTRGGVIVLFIL
jgi:hypothetical protein